MVAFNAHLARREKEREREREREREGPKLNQKEIYDHLAERKLSWKGRKKEREGS
jgi:hypothetical protein